jgi:16S rRNA C967 or C1407 C5-methylase (RsmB/RsmF family)
MGKTSQKSRKKNFSTPSKGEIFRERIEKINPDILPELKKRPEFGVRINRHLADLEVVEELKREGFDLRPVQWYPYLFTLPMEQRREILKTSAYTGNKIYIQSPSSVLSALSLNPQPTDWVLDLAAAPGGKSLIFSEVAEKVSAVEPDKKRFFRMKRNFKEHKAKNIQTYNKDGRFIYKSCPGWFDKVFLDAPCSSEAHIDLEKEGLTWWNLRRIKRFSQLQKELILSAFRSLKPGGTMIYATCTFAPEENEEVIAHLLEREPSARLVEVEVPISNKMEGITQWEGKNYPDEVKKCCRILPSGAYTGFFFAKIEKEE